MIIGRRQNRLIAAQLLSGSQSAERDYDLALRNHKVALLNRREEVIRRFRAVHTEYMAHAHLNDEQWRELVLIFQMSQLIFSEGIVKRLDQAAQSIMRYKIHDRRERQYRDNGKDDQADEQLDKAFKEDDTAFEALNGLLDELISAARVVD